MGGGGGGGSGGGVRIKLAEQNCQSFAIMCIYTFKKFDNPR